VFVMDTGGKTLIKLLLKKVSTLYYVISWYYLKIQFPKIQSSRTNETFEV
jgi:hypothetical protein